MDFSTFLFSDLTLTLASGSCIVLADVKQDGVKSTRTSLVMELPPKDFIEMSGQHRVVDSAHVLEPGLGVLPEALHMVRAGTGEGADKVACVVDGEVLVRGLDRQDRDVVVAGPHVRVDDGAWGNVLANDGEECLGGAIRDQLQEALLACGTIPAEDPALLHHVPDIVLALGHEGLIYLNDDTRPADHVGVVQQPG